MATLSFLYGHLLDLVYLNTLTPVFVPLSLIQSSGVYFRLEGGGGKCLVPKVKGGAQFYYEATFGNFMFKRGKPNSRGQANP